MDTVGYLAEMNETITMMSDTDTAEAVRIPGATIAPACYWLASAIRSLRACR